MKTISKIVLFTLLLTIISMSSFAIDDNCFSEIYSCDGLRVDYGGIYSSDFMGQVVITNNDARIQFRNLLIPAIYNHEKGETIFNYFIKQPNENHMVKHNIDPNGTIWKYYIDTDDNNSAKIIITANDEYVTDWIFYNCY